MPTGFAACHPLVILVFYLAAILLPLFSLRPLFLLTSFVCALGYGLLRCGGKQMRKNLLFTLPILIFCVLINPLFVGEGTTPLFCIFGKPMTLEAVLYGACLAVMLLAVVCWFSSFNHVFTSDKLIYLLGKSLPTLALLLSMILRLVPLLKNRFAEISLAQRGIGKSHNRGGPVKRARALVSELSVLISWSLEESIVTSDAMRARGYGLFPRTSFSLFRFTPRDGVLLFWILLLLTGVLVGFFGGTGSVIFYPTLVVAPISFPTLFTELCYLALLLLPPLFDCFERMKLSC